MARRRLLLAVNLHASRATASIGSAIAFLASQGFDLDIRQSDDRDSLGSLVRDGAGGCDAIVVAGGDGTLNGALPALIQARKPVGILPFGTANDLALTLGIPADPVAAAEVIAAGATRNIDVGRANDCYFLNVASIGLSVKIAEKQDEELKRQWGIFSYVVAAAGALTEAERFEATITCGERSEAVRAYQIAVGNGIHFGGGLTVSPEARIDDGLLDVYAIETTSVAELIALAPRLRDGTLVERDDVAFFRGPTARIETRTPMPVNTDGEVTTATPADFSVLPKALTIFAPREGD
ncbi:MAG TPA: lipid kinase [Bauldia sp.]|nr:lipid kinase [Bauldia sp.]